MTPLDAHPNSPPERFMLELFMTHFRLRLSNMMLYGLFICASLTWSRMMSPFATPSLDSSAFIVSVPNTSSHMYLSLRGATRFLQHPFPCKGNPYASIQPMNTHKSCETKITLETSVHCTWIRASWVQQGAKPPNRQILATLEPSGLRAGTPACVAVESHHESTTWRTSLSWLYRKPCQSDPGCLEAHHVRRMYIV